MNICMMFQNSPVIDVWFQAVYKIFPVWLRLHAAVSISQYNQRNHDQSERSWGHCFLSGIGAAHLWRSFPARSAPADGFPKCALAKAIKCSAGAKWFLLLPRSCCLPLLGYFLSAIVSHVYNSVHSWVDKHWCMFSADRRNEYKAGKKNRKDFFKLQQRQTFIYQFEHRLMRLTELTFSH